MTVFLHTELTGVTYVTHAHMLVMRYCNLYGDSYCWSRLLRKCTYNCWNGLFVLYIEIKCCKNTNGAYRALGYAILKVK